MTHSNCFVPNKWHFGQPVHAFSAGEFGCTAVAFGELYLTCRITVVLYVEI